MPDKECKECYDHLGNKYKSVGDMCKAYKVKYSTYRDRIRAGWALGYALSNIDSNKKKCKDHLGDEPNTIAGICEHWNIKSSAIYARQKSDII